MTFHAFSGAVLFFGIAALATALYLLQRLRVRHREVQVPTMLFWQKALEESRARVLVRRFRHPLAYLFILLIASLLWTLVADPRRDQKGAIKRIYVLDLSAEMAAGGRLDRALGALTDELGVGEGATVIAAAHRPRTILTADESPKLLLARKIGLNAEATPSTVSRTITEIAHAIPVEERTEIVTLAASAVPEAVRALLPANVTLREIPAERPADQENPFAIVGIGIAETRGGSFTTLDLDVVVRSAANPVVAAMLGTARVQPAETLDGDADGTRIFRFADLPATGETFTFEGPADGFPADDRAAITLPNRRPVRVSVAPALDALIRPILESYAAVRITDADADVRISDQEPAAAGVPTLAFIPGRPNGADFLVTGDDGGDALGEIFGGIDRATIARLPAVGDATRPEPVRAERPADAGGVRTIRVAADLLGDGASFTKTDAFPVFVAQAIRWLAAVEDLVPEARAGRPYAGTAALITAPGDLRLIAADEAIHLPYVGAFTDERGRAITASLADPETSASYLRSPILSRPVPAKAAASIFNSDAVIASLLGALVFFGLLVEWVLVKKGRMP